MIKLTWIDFSIRSDTVCIHNVLEGRSKLVSFIISWWIGRRLHAIEDRWNLTSTFFLKLIKVCNEGMAIFTVPLLRAILILSNSLIGHQTSAIRHFWVTSMLKRFKV